MSDFASRRENCANATGHPAGSPGLDCTSPRKSAALGPWASNLPLYVSFHKFSAESKYDATLRQFGRSGDVADGKEGLGQIQGQYRTPARTLVGPVAKKSFALKGAYDPAAKVDLSLIPDFEEPASFKSEVHSGEILEMELPLMFSVRIPGESPLFPEVSDALVPVLTRRTHYKVSRLDRSAFAFFCRIEAYFRKRWSFEGG